MEYCWNLFDNSNTTNHPHPHPHPHPHAWDSLDLPSPTTSREHWTAYPPPPSMPHHHGRGDPHYVNPDPHLTCLKLGKRNYFEDATATPTPTPTPKKGKSYIHAPEGMVVPRCQVEGCGAQLVDAKDYHRRHKVCEAHAKEPRVVVLGMEQRFCQQCSRFHAVSEFDEAKRSCRRRLAGHNERRRKSSQEQNALARKHSQDIKMMGIGGMLLNSSECAHSPLSQASDLPARCSAALRDLIAENRASCRHLFQMDSFRAGPIPGAHHVTLNLMQSPNSAFGLLSKSSKQDAHHDHQQDSSHHIWKLPLGY